MLSQLEVLGCLLRGGKAVIRHTVSDSSSPSLRSGGSSVILAQGTVSVSFQRPSHPEDSSSRLQFLPLGKLKVLLSSAIWGALFLAFCIQKCFDKTIFQ